MTSKIEQVISTDDKKAIAAMERLEKSFNKLTAAQRRTTQVSVQGAERTSTGFENIGRQLSRVERRFHFVRIGIQAVTQATQEWRQKMQDLAASSEKMAQIQGKLSITAGARGDVSKVREMVKGLGVTREQAHQAISATAGTRGASSARKMELAQAAASAWQVGQGSDEFGSLLSALEEQRPGKRSIEQLKDEAIKMQAAGVSAQEIRSSRTDGAVRSDIARRVQKNAGAKRLTFEEAKTRFQLSNPEAYFRQGVDQKIDQANEINEDFARLKAAKDAGVTIAGSRGGISAIAAGLVGVADSIPGVGAASDYIGAEYIRGQELNALNAASPARAEAASKLAAAGSITAQDDAARGIASTNANTKATEALTSALKQGPIYNPSTNEKR